MLFFIFPPSSEIERKQIYSRTRKYIVNKDTEVEVYIIAGVISSVDSTDIPNISSCVKMDVC